MTVADYVATFVSRPGHCNNNNNNNPQTVRQIDSNMKGATISVLAREMHNSNRKAFQCAPL